MLTGLDVEKSLVEPSVTLVHDSNPFRKIELAGRTCYKSEARITKESATRFVQSLIKHGHTAMVEHASLVFELTYDAHAEVTFAEYVLYLESDPYIHITYNDAKHRSLVSANIRAIMQRHVVDPIYRALVDKYSEFDWPVYIDSSHNYTGVVATIVDIRKIKDLSTEEFNEHFNLTAKFVTDRGVTHEMVRHRPFSFAQESTRYCNYSKDQFGGHLAFCKPTTYDNWTPDQQGAFCNALAIIDKTYNILTTSKDPLQAQQVRAILPNTLKTEIVVSGNAAEWQHFFNLRSKGTTGAPHPDIKYVADIARKKMNKYIRSLKYDNYFAF